MRSFSLPQPPKLCQNRSRTAVPGIEFSGIQQKGGKLAHWRHRRSASGMSRMSNPQLVTSSSVVAAAESTTAAAPEKAANVQGPGREIRVHYLRRDCKYEGWGLHAWGDVKQETEWSSPLQPARNGDKLTWTIELIPEQAKNNFNHWVGLMVHKGDEKDSGREIVEIAGDMEDLYFLSGSLEVFKEEPIVSELPVGNLAKAAAHWVEADTLIWRVAPNGTDGQPRQFQLAWSSNAGLKLSGQGLGAADGFIDLEAEGKDIPHSVRKKFPHLSGCTTLRIPADANLQELVKAQVAVVAREGSGQTVDVTGVQLQGVLDAKFVYEGPLGANVRSDGIDIAVWAPTAKEVTLRLWNQPEGGPAEECAMSESNGVWSQKVPASWLWKYYTYRVRVYDVWTQQIQTFETTDPYSYSLAADGARTQIVRMDDPTLCPEGWEEERPPQNPNYRHPVDMSVYELHIRDFSISDPRVPEQHRGKYAAFAQDGLGVQHLRELQAAGLTHVHLLPAYDYGSVPEKAADQRMPEGDLSMFAADSEEQQERVLAVADQDAFNWGYDPVHYSAPEGSYASEPHGAARVREFRQMVQALHAMGLRVVLDVVYNHTFHSGLDGLGSRYAVFDKIVPGYYHRRTEAGDLCTSACCNNTAPEHLMFERLIVDDTVHWARNYKIDAYRFDIMGHLFLHTMRKIQAGLGELTLEQDGVNGSSIYVYGETWDFGEVSHNQRGRNACQANIGGTGIGGFNDRIRDALLGGSPFASPQHQGWVTGLGTQPSEFTKATMDAQQQREQLLDYGDLLKLSLAGLLREFELETWQGARKKGRQIFYGMQSAGYCTQPWENVNYASCHDNQTLFDQVIEKVAHEVDLEQRLRMQTLTQALIAFGQGIAFFHAGCELLRSKSLDRDSYNSGDWFNRLDWTLQSNNFGVGLPVATKNRENWHLKQPLLADPGLKPTPEHIRGAKQRFLELLRLRYATPLLRLRNADDIMRQLSFHNTGPDQVPGVVVMEIKSASVAGAEGGTEDPLHKRIIVVFNARPDVYEAGWPAGAGALQLHEIQQRSEDRTLRHVASNAADKALTVPGRTAAVFVEPK